MPYAPWFTRVIGHVIDVLVPAPFIIAAELLAGDSGQRVLYACLIAAGVLLSVYNRIYLAGKTGQSWGRRAVGIRLVGDRTSQPIGFARTLLREFAHLLNTFTLYIGYLFPLWTGKRQTLADMATRTVVVTAR
jgi:uncharacterized RDD family membrane protein YckC